MEMNEGWVDSLDSSRDCCVTLKASSTGLHLQAVFCPRSCRSHFHVDLGEDLTVEVSYILTLQEDLSRGKMPPTGMVYETIRANNINSALFHITGRLLE